jgi:hypothetical protein
MDRLYLPPSLRYLEPMRATGDDSLDHASFLYDLVEALRPRLIVDVGTGAGVSLSIACESMRDHDVGGLAYGIDTWEDDESKSDDDPTRWAALNNFLHTYFRGVSYLMKMRGSEALPHFAEKSVDVLRLNAPRSGAPLASLIGAWQPRLAPGGVLLCPGVNDPEEPHLARDWKRATEDRDTFVFPHKKGLGVLRNPPEQGGPPASDLLDLLTSEEPDDREGLARFYEHADRYHSTRLEVHGKRGELHRKK